MLWPICTHRDTQTGRFVYLTVAGIWFNLRHVGLTQAVGRDQVVGVVKGWEGVEDLTAPQHKKILFICWKNIHWVSVSLYWLIVLSGSHQTQMSRDEHVRSDHQIICSHWILNSCQKVKWRLQHFVVCSSVTCHILKARKRCTCCNFNIMRWDSLHKMET